MPPAKTRKGRRRGGGIIGKGTYGCIYKPSLKCENKNESRENRISKLLSRNEGSKEMEQAALFRNRIDPSQKYFLYGDQICDLNVTIQNDAIKQLLEANIAEQNRNKRKCTASNIINSGQISASIVQMPYGGKTPGDFKIHPTYYLGFFKTLENIFTGIRLLHRNGYVHHDVKKDNILIIPGMGARIIDFGLMRRIDEINQMFENNQTDQLLIYTTPYAYWPLMSFALYLNKAMYKNVIQGKMYEKIMNDWTKNCIRDYKNIVPPQVYLDFSDVGPRHLYNKDEFIAIYENISTVDNLAKYIDIYGAVISMSMIFSAYFNLNVQTEPSNPQIPIVCVKDSFSGDYIPFGNFIWTDPNLEAWFDDFVKYVAEPFYLFVIAVCTSVDYSRPMIIDNLLMYYRGNFLHNMKLLLYNGDDLRSEFINYLAQFKPSILSSTVAPEISVESYKTPEGLLDFTDYEFFRLPPSQNNTTRKRVRNNRPNNQKKMPRPL